MAGQTLSELIIAARYRAGLTQAELARKAGLSQRTVRALESSEVTRPHPQTLRSLAEALQFAEQSRGDLFAARRR